MPRPSELYPLSTAALRDRLDRELADGGEVFGVPRAAIWRPDPAVSVATTHFGAPLATPVGPAAGPHTQLAANVLAGWLAGGRFFELKTVQILDDLVIPRPCIHAPHVGYNVEWSQELRVPESAVEYAQAWVLLHAAAARLGLDPGVIFDLSVGYDLAGIQDPKVAGFLQTMADARPLLDPLRAAWGIDTPDTISRTLTLSTFHGCPAHEIEAIATHLMRAHHLDVVVKLNPTLLGEATVRRILHDQLGYTHIALNPDAFVHDLQWAQLLDMLPRLRAVADGEGVGLGVKLSNTLVCRSSEPPFGEGDLYLSGPPLHVLAATLAAQVLGATDLPVTFSAGVDAQNLVDVLRVGIRPVTVCTDLLKGKGYARLAAHVRSVEAALTAAGATSLAGLPSLSPDTWAAQVVVDPRYHHDQNHLAPKKVGTRLVLLDCLTCDKCVPVCPNLAIQTFSLPVGEHPAGQVTLAGTQFSIAPGPAVRVKKRHQIGIVADVCNRCGQCDPTCPEDGGPFAEKPNLFVDPRAWAEHPDRAGFHFADGTLHWRGARGDHTWTPLPDGQFRWTTPVGTLTLSSPTAPVAAHGAGTVDLADAVLLHWMWTALLTGEGWRPPTPGAAPA